MSAMVSKDVRLLNGSFDPREVTEKTAKHTITNGGVASFTGYVSADNGVEALELSHYAPLTLPGMEDLANKAEQRFDLKVIAIVHRVGLIQPGEPIVCVAAATRHRRDALNAVDFCMDHLKSAAWFWKREKRGGKWHWIEPRDQDRADLLRWS